MKKVFIGTLIYVLILLLIQIDSHFFPAVWESRIITVNTDWIGIILLLVMIILALAILNSLAYRHRTSTSEPDHVDRWILASSSVVVAYYVLSRIVLPLILLSKVS